MKSNKGLAFRELVLFIIALIGLIFLIFFVFQTKNEGLSLLDKIKDFF